MTGSIIAGFLVAILVQIFVVPWQKRKILGHGKSTKPVEFTFGDSDGNWTLMCTVNLYESNFTLACLWKVKIKFGKIECF